MQFLKAHKLNWEVVKEPLHNQHGPITTHFSLTRTDNHESVSVVGRRYKPTSNKEVLEFIDAYCREGGATLDDAGILRGGAMVWARARLNTTITVGKSDTVQGYIMFGIPHLQGRSLTARLTTIRDACNNTLHIASRSGRYGLGEAFRMNHSNDFDERQIKRAKETIDAQRLAFKDFGVLANKLHKKKLDDEEAARLIASVFQPQWDGDEQTQGPRLQKILESYKSAPGAEATAWGVLNAVTHYVDHVACRTPDARQMQGQFGRGALRKAAMLAQVQS